MAKIGEGHAMGMFRKGLTEGGQYLLAFNNGGTQIIEDPAIWPNQTQGEIAQARGGMSLDDLREYAADKAREADREMENGNARDRDDFERE
jgi:hypothetical protein